MRPGQARGWECPTTGRRQAGQILKRVGYGLVTEARRSITSAGFPIRNGNAIAFRKWFESAAVARMGTLRHDFPPVTQHTSHVPIHCLHAWQQSLPVVCSSPIFLIRKRFNLHKRFAFLLSEVSLISYCANSGPQRQMVMLFSLTFDAGESCGDHERIGSEESESGNSAREPGPRGGS